MASDAWLCFQAEKSRLLAACFWARAAPVSNEKLEEEPLDLLAELLSDLEVEREGGREGAPDDREPSNKEPLDFPVLLGLGDDLDDELGLKNDFPPVDPEE